MTLHVSTEELKNGLSLVLNSPKNLGRLDLLVRRPAVDEREVIDHGRLDLISGLEGDNWPTRGSANPETQLTLMNSQLINLLTQNRDKWKLAGDQLFVDMDLSVDNLPVGTQLAIGSAVIEVTATPHNGCKKFSERFGLDALKFISTPENKPLRLRGLYARVIQAGELVAGDVIRKVEG